MWNVFYPLGVSVLGKRYSGSHIVTNSLLVCYEVNQTVFPSKPVPFLCYKDLGANARLHWWQRFRKVDKFYSFVLFAIVVLFLECRFVLFNLLAVSYPMSSLAQPF